MGFETMSFESKGGVEKEKTGQRKELREMENLISLVEKNNNDPEKQRVYREGLEKEKSVLENYPPSDEKKAFEICIFMMENFKGNPEVARRILKSTPGYKANYY